MSRRRYLLPFLFLLFLHTALCRFFLLSYRGSKHAISGERGAAYTGLYGVWYKKLLLVAPSQDKIDVYIEMFNTDMYRWIFSGLSLELCAEKGRSEKKMPRLEGQGRRDL